MTTVLLFFFHSFSLSGSVVAGQVIMYDSSLTSDTLKTESLTVSFFGGESLTRNNHETETLSGSS